MTANDPDGAPGDGPRPEREIAAELRLRPDRPKVVRLSRKVLGILAGVSALAVGGSLIWALQSSRPTPPAELYNTDNRSTADGLATAPLAPQNSSSANSAPTHTLIHHTHKKSFANSLRPCWRLCSS